MRIVSDNCKAYLKPTYEHYPDSRLQYALLAIVIQVGEAESKNQDHIFL